MQFLNKLQALDFEKIKTAKTKTGIEWQTAITRLNLKKSKSIAILWPYAGANNWSLLINIIPDEQEWRRSTSFVWSILNFKRSTGRTRCSREDGEQITESFFNVSELLGEACEKKNFFDLNKMALGSEGFEFHLLLAASL
jgi:hypothetical protein